MHAHLLTLPPLPPSLCGPSASTVFTEHVTTSVSLKSPTDRKRPPAIALDGQQ